jgi:uroporphyrin-III C-methyltransferase
MKPSPAFFPAPQSGASLVLSFQLRNKLIVIIGSGTLAASRAFSALEANSTVVVLAKGGLECACEELRWRALAGQLTIIDLDGSPGDDIAVIHSHLEIYADKCRFVCVTDTLLSADVRTRRSRSSAAQISRICDGLRIPVNVTDMPDLCDFSFTSTHRFESPESGRKTPLQIGITTNGQGCRLGGRLRRDIVASLPKDVGAAVEKVGQFRALVKAADAVREEKGEEWLDELDGESVTPNRPVPMRSHEETALESARRRMKWVAQISEYWPLSRLAIMTQDDMESVLSEKVSPGGLDNASMHSLPLSPPSVGRIFLVGSGPGHPSLLTLAAHTALTKHAHLILSDKLVPASVLALVPAHVEIRIARKFPGNSDGAQNEMMKAAVEAVKRGSTVVRVRLIFFSPLNG